MERSTYRTGFSLLQLRSQNSRLSVKKQLLQLCILHAQAAADFCRCLIPGLRLFQIFRRRFSFGYLLFQMRNPDFPVFQNLLFFLNLLQRKLCGLCLLKLSPGPVSLSPSSKASC